MKRKMKKTVIGILAAAVVMSIGVVSAFAGGHGRGSRYTDANNDGVCDYAKSICQYIDADGDDICDNCDKEREHKTHYGRYFADDDHDGACDHYGTRQGQGHCRGRSHR